MNLFTWSVYLLILSAFNTAFSCQEGWVSFGSSCYKFFSTRKTWHEARSVCLGLQADLVVVSSQEENEFLYHNNPFKVDMFIGITDVQDESNFTWVKTGECSQYSNFGTGEPNNAGYGEDCVELDYTNSDKWNDVPCSMAFAFGCEKNNFEDTEPPSYGSSCPQDIHLLTKPNENSVSVYWQPPVWTDDSNCFSSFSNSHYPGHVLEIPKGSLGLTVTVMYTATDMVGRTNTCSFKIAATYEKSYNLCLNGGKMQISGGTFFCACAPGFSGLVCQVNDTTFDGAPTSSTPTVNDVPTSSTPIGNGAPSSTPTTANGVPAAFSCQEGWISFGSSCYKFFSTRKPWHEARSVCLGLEADLVVVSSQEENDFLYYNNPFKVDLFIGITDVQDESNFTWVETGECSQYSNFGVGEPNNYGNDEDCVELDYTHSNKWNDVSCSRIFSFVCEQNNFEDTEPPSYGSSCPQDIHLLTKPNENSVSVYWQPPVWTDDSNCFSSFSNSHYPGHVLEIPKGSLGLTVTVTYTATDMVGRTNTCSFKIAASYENCVNGRKMQTTDGTFFCACAPGFSGLVCELNGTSFEGAPTSSTPTGNGAPTSSTPTGNGVPISSTPTIGNGVPTSGTPTGNVVPTNSTLTIGNVVPTSAKPTGNGAPSSTSTIGNGVSPAFSCQEGWVSFGSSCYKFFSTGKTWHEARSECLDLEADLVVVSSQEENDFLYHNNPFKVDMFIGITDVQEESNFTWVDTGECSQYSNFAVGEPNNAGNEDCVELDYTNSDKWNDVPCYIKSTFVCEQNNFEDTEPPSYGSSCPQDIHLLTKPNETSVSVYWQPPVWTDDSNCFSSFSNSHYPGHVLEIPNGSLGLTVKVTYTATDMVGRTNTCSFKIAASYEKSYNLCVNGGKMHITDGRFFCACASGFSGLVCELNDTSFQGAPTSSIPAGNSAPKGNKGNNTGSSQLQSSDSGNGLYLIPLVVCLTLVIILMSFILVKVLRKNRINKTEFAIHMHTTTHSSDEENNEIETPTALLL